MTPLKRRRRSSNAPTKFCLSCHDGTVAIGDINWFDKQAWGAGSELNPVKHDGLNDPGTLGIRLFTDDGTGGITAGATASMTGIECSSCHDPHNGAGKVYDAYFLRGKLTGNVATDAATGYICLKCHVK